MMKKICTVMILLLVLCLLVSCTGNVKPEESKQESMSDVQSSETSAPDVSDEISGDASNEASHAASSDISGDISSDLSDLSSESSLDADSMAFSGNVSYNGTTSGKEETSGETSEESNDISSDVSSDTSSKEPPKPVHQHSYKGQNCTEGGVCSCGATGKPLGHKMSKATCAAPATCSRCDLTEGEPLGHAYKGGYCTRCKDTNGPLSPAEAELFKRSNKLTDEENAEALKAARALVAQVDAALPNGSDFERIAMAANLVAQEYRKGDHVEKGNYYHQAYGVLVKRESSCAGCSRTLGLLLSLMGYEWTHVNENKWNHQWVEVNLNGETIWADGQIGYVGEGEYPFAEKVE